MKHLVALPAVALAGLFAATAHATPTIGSISVFATGAAVGGTGPDSVTVGSGSVWVQYGNGASSTGASGSSTIVQYNQSTGAIQSQYSIAGNVDGLKINPTSGIVWALQNQDGNATLSLINPATKTVSGPFSYASPPYVYGPNSGRGYDDVAFANNNVFLSYTNPASPTDPILQQLNQGNTPAGTLTTTNILSAGQTGTLPDSDSLRATPAGDLVQTAEGDGPGSGSTGQFTIVHNPGTTSQTSTNVVVFDPAGNNVFGLDDVVVPGVTAGTLYLTDSANNGVYAVNVTGLDPNAPLASIAGFNLPNGVVPTDVARASEIGIVNLATGVATPFITGADLPGNFTIGDFVPAAVPEPSALALFATGVLSLFGLARLRQG